MSSSDATPPLAITGTSVRGDRRRETVDVGPVQHPVAADVGDHERAAAGKHRARRRAAHRSPRSSRGPRAHRRGGRAPTATARSRLRVDELGIAHGGRTHHDAAHTQRRPTPRRRRRAHSPTGLHRAPDPQRRGDRGDDGPVDRIAAAGGVEVDHVDPRRPASANDGDRDRIVAVDRLGVVVALGEPHHTTAAQVDRRVQVGDEPSPAAHATPDARRPDEVAEQPQPGVADFSGWNWVANTLPAERGVEGAAVVAGGCHHRRVVGHTVQRVHEVHPRRRPEPGEHRVVGDAPVRAGSTASAVASRRAGSSARCRG
jgi:hypothetical protein